MRYRRYMDLTTVSTHRHSRVCLVILQSREPNLDMNHVTYTIPLDPTLAQLQSRAAICLILHGTLSNKSTGTLYSHCTVQRRS